MSIRHKKVSLKPDDPNTDLVRPSDWNAAHDGPVDIADIPPIPDTHLLNPAALKRSLSSRPDLANFLPTKYWQPPAAMGMLIGTATDGDYLYAALATTPTTLVKLDLLTLSIVQSVSLPAIYADITALIFYSASLYACFFTTPALVLKIDPNDLSILASWTGGAGQNNADDLCATYNYIFVRLRTAPGKIIKLGAGSLAFDGAWTSAQNFNYPGKLATDDQFLFTFNPANVSRVYKINFLTMLTFSIHARPAGYQWPTGLVTAGGYLYVLFTFDPCFVLKLRISDFADLGNLNIADSTSTTADIVTDNTSLFASRSSYVTYVDQINLADLTLVNTWTSPALLVTPKHLSVIGPQLYLSIYAPFAQIYVIDIPTFLTNDNWTGPLPYDEISSIVTLGDYLYAATDSQPASILKLDQESLSLISTWVAPFALTSILALCTDGNYLYAMQSGSSPRLLKFSIPNLTLVSSLTPFPLTFSTCFLLFDGSRINAVYDSAPFLYATFAIEPFEFLNSFEGIGPFVNPTGITFDGTYTFVCFDITPASILKIDPTSPAPITSWVSASGAIKLLSICFDGTYIYVIAGNAIPRYLAINPDTMIDDLFVNEPSGPAGAGPITCMGSSLVATLKKLPIQLRQLSNPDLSALPINELRSDLVDVTAILSAGKFLYLAAKTSAPLIVQKMLKDRYHIDT